MKRKLIKQGGVGLTIYIPKKWINERKLRSGDEVEVTPVGNDLLLSATAQNTLTTKTIPLASAHKSYLRSIIASAYKSGYDEIVLTFSKPPKLQDTNGVVNSFTGLEVVSQSKNSMTVKSFLIIRKEDVEHLIIKMFQSVKLLITSIGEGWGTADKESLRSLFCINIRKLRDHCLRAIHCTNYGGDKSYDYYDLVTQLEKIAAEFYEILELISSQNIKDRTTFKELSARFNDFYECYLTKDFHNASALWEKQNAETKECTKCQQNQCKRSLTLQHYYLMKKYAHIASRIASICS